MKTFLLSIFSIVSLLINAQNPEIWGITSYGGQYNSGTIFKTDANGDNHSVEHSLFKYDGSLPYGSPIEASNGKIYGLTMIGGSYGVLFEYDPFTKIYLVKVNFNGEEKGSTPRGSLIQASNGKLYGHTNNGGVYNKGVLFEYDIFEDIFTKLVDFDGANTGSSPNGSVFQAINGKLYGFAKEGGINDLGTLFEYELSSNIFTKLIDFDGINNGSHPHSSLIQTTNEKLYGLTPGGGIHDKGVLFEFNLTTNTINKLFDFGGTNQGSYPMGDLCKSIEGKLYGLTPYGGESNNGTLFEFDILDNTVTKLLDFDDDNGSRPYGSLIQIENEKFYGLTVEGGGTDQGVIFEFDASSNQLTKKIDFEGIENGGRPEGSLIQTMQGTLYGLTNVGGIEGRGTLFEYDVSTNIITNRIEFFGSEKGRYPIGSLTQASNGKFYGLTVDGGTFNNGVLFEYNPVTKVYLKKIDFNSTNGSKPSGRLLQGNNGKLYGLTKNGGLHDSGVLFEYDYITNTLSKKYDFEENGAYGSIPQGTLIQASNGKIYGSTYYGGIYNKGTIFEYEILSNMFTKKIDFDGINMGCNPSDGLIETSNGKLYGLTKIGGEHNAGVLYEYDPMTNILLKKIDFENSIIGSKPMGRLVQAEDGNLYGVTYEGGLSNNGILFKFNPVTNIITKKVDFYGIDKGHLPNGCLIKASNGKLYGLTHAGGLHDKGIMYEYDVTDNTFVKKIDFNGNNGLIPTNLIELNICYSASRHSIEITLCSGSSYTFADGTEHFKIDSNEIHISTLKGQAADGCDSIISENIFVKQAAEQTSLITGQNPVCINSNATFSVDSVPGVIYYWSLPNNWSGSGNNSTIEVTTGNNGGTITVVPFNECGMGISRAFKVSVTNSLPIAYYSYRENQTKINFINFSQNADRFYWDFGDGSNSTDKNPKHDYLTSGQYITSLIASNICGVDTFELVIDIEIENIEEINNSIYPNPTDGIITIQGDKIQSIKITDAKGCIIKHITTADKYHVVDLSNEAKGFYFINVITQKEVLIKKIVLK